jgi:hypothetical protein
MSAAITSLVIMAGSPFENNAQASELDTLKSG